MGARTGIGLPGGVPPTYHPGCQVRGMCGAAKEMGHRAVGGLAVGAGGVIGLELGECASVRLGQQLFSWVNWRGSGHDHFVLSVPSGGRPQSRV